MRFLVDQPVSPILAEWLRSIGHDAQHVRDRGMSAATDTAILDLARSEQRNLVTADLDFSRLIALSGQDQPGLILFRAGNISDSEMLALLRRVLAEVSENAIATSIVVVDADSIRVARLPIRGG
ncbi:MAG: DUF5615 family PIN-like protein [Phycisphaeraceae bacterium]|nr:DUF5615 family PIN-like protein [Phycisphaeraceae bacterium]